MIPHKDEKPCQIWREFTPTKGLDPGAEVDAVEGCVDDVLTERDKHGLSGGTVRVEWRDDMDKQRLDRKDAEG